MNMPRENCLWQAVTIGNGWYNKPAGGNHRCEFRHQAVTVTFFTYSPLGQEAFISTPTPTRWELCAKSQTVKIAKGPRHIVF